MANQNRYNRAFDNDREPEQEKTLKDRLKYRVTVLKEDAGDFGKSVKRLVNRMSSAASEAQKNRAEIKQRKAEKKKGKDIGRNADDSYDATRSKEDITSFGVSDAGAVVFSDVHPHTGRKRHVLEITGRFWFYCALFVVAFFFTQALHAKASNLFFGFVLMFPPALLIYALISRAALKVEILSNGATVQKNEGYLYELRIINSSILPYPFVEAWMLIPQSNSVRCTERAVCLSMSPRGEYHMKNEVRFRFRGTYHIGVNCFYVYDFFRIFRVKIDVRNANTVQVLPRKFLLLDEAARAVSDSPDHTKRSSVALERVEVGDIREYRLGDPLKSVHWNLSSRSDDLIVKDYDTGTTKKTYVYCDLAARYPKTPPEVPEVSVADKKAAEQAAKEKHNAEKRLKEAEERAKKRGVTLTEEERSALLKTKSEKKAEKAQRKEDQRQQRELADLRILAKKDPKKAAQLRDILYDQMRMEEEERAAKERKKALEGNVIDCELLREDRFYEDMNEYCADGVIELSIATALRELRAGNEVVLAWYDRRSPSGVCAYSFRTSAEFDSVYRLFATAPLAEPDQFVVKLATLSGDTSGMKQIFVTASIDREAVDAFCSMPVSPDGTSNAGCEVVLYHPEDRFLYPKERGLYMEGCASELATKGFRFSVGSLKHSIQIGGDERAKRA